MHKYKLFKRNYEDEVRSALSEGSLKVEPHLDPVFQESAPRMSRFLRSSI